MSYIYLALSGILFGGVVFGAKILSNMGASLFEIMLYSNLIPAVLIFYFARKDLSKIFTMPLSVTLLFMSALFLINIGQYTPLFFDVPVTLVVLLLYLQPVWTILIRRFYFHHHVRTRAWFVVAAMVIGLVFLVKPWANFSFSIGGIALALLGGLGLSVWVYLTQYMSREKISPWGTYWSCCIYSLLPIVILYLSMFDSGLDAKFLAFSDELSPKLWAVFLVYSLLIITLPNLLIFYNNQDVSPVVIGAILLLEPITGIILDVIFEGMILSWNIFVGGAIILLSNFALLYHHPVEAQTEVNRQ